MGVPDLPDLSLNGRPGFIYLPDLSKVSRIYLPDLSQFRPKFRMPEIGFRDSLGFPDLPDSQQTNKINGESHQNRSQTGTRPG